MNIYLIKRKLLRYWICAYYYNNELILNLKRKHRRSSNLILLLISPYVLVKSVLCGLYEGVWGKHRVVRIFDEERETSYKHEIAMVSISKNEGPYIKEWIEFHKLVGFTKFYFYDNESEDNTREVLKPYIDEGVVEYTLIEGKGKQLDAYNDAIAKHKNECRWMAFLDMDEYLVPTKPFEKIYNVVSELVRKAGKGAAGIGVNWCIFGSAHLEKKPEGLIMENFIYRGQGGKESHWGNYHIKTICNPRLVKNYISPHYPIYKLGGV